MEWMMNNEELKWYSGKINEIKKEIEKEITEERKINELYGTSEIIITNHNIVY